MQILKDLTPTELVKRLQAQQAMRRDMVVPMKAIKSRMGQIHLQLSGNSKLGAALAGLGVSVADAPDMIITSTAFSQLCEKVNVPLKYMERCAHDCLPLFDHNVNYWTARGDQQKWLLRTWLDDAGDPNILRAVLSDSYKMIDNLDIILAAADAIKEMNVEVQFDTSDLSEKGMYLRVIAPKIEHDAAKILEGYRFRPNERGQSNYRGDGICSGLIIRNSEVGHAAFSIAPRLVVGACANGMIFTDEMMRHVHLGTKMDESVVEWSDRTKRLNSQTIISQITDAVRKFLSPKFLGQMVQKIEATKDVEITNIQATIINAGSMLSLSDEKKNDLLRFFTQGGDTSGFGLVQAMTYVAHAADPEERWALEGAAVRIAQPAIMRRIDVPRMLKSKELPALSDC